MEHLIWKFTFIELPSNTPKTYIYDCAMLGNFWNAFHHVRHQSVIVRWEEIWGKTRISVFSLWSKKCILTAYLSANFRCRDTKAQKISRLRFAVFIRREYPSLQVKPPSKLKEFRIRIRSWEIEGSRGAKAHGMWDFTYKIDRH